MRRTGYLLLSAALLGACAAEAPSSLLDDYEEVDATTILDAPSARPGKFAPHNKAVVERGEYLVEPLGRGSCHTDGALVGDPDFKKSLGGSKTGIAYEEPSQNLGSSVWLRGQDFSLLAPRFGRSRRL